MTTLKITKPLPTLSADVGKRLAIVIIVSGMLLSISYISIRRLQILADFHKETLQITNQLSSILALPVWSINKKEIQSILDYFESHPLVHQIHVYDKKYIDIKTPADEHKIPLKLYSLTSPIFFLKNNIASLEVTFYPTPLSLLFIELISFTLGFFVLIVLVILIATRFILKRYLQQPVKQMLADISIISEGNYRHRLTLAERRELAEISSTINQLAEAIDLHTKKLEENQNKLEKLNNIIISIFSKPDSNKLIDSVINEITELTQASSVSFSANQEMQLLKLPFCHAFPYFKQGGKNSSNLINYPITSEQALNLALKIDNETIGSFEIIPTTRILDNDFTLIQSIISICEQALIRQNLVAQAALSQAELQIAASIQQAILPKLPNGLDSIKIESLYLPMNKVGGDWFEIFTSSDKSKTFILVGDITGQGIGPGLITTAISGALRALQPYVKTATDSPVIQCNYIMNVLKQLVADISSLHIMSMTSLIMCIDHLNHELYIINSGHLAPIIISSPNEGNLKHCLSLSPAEGSELVQKHKIHASDIIFLHTDGLINALSPEGVSFQHGLWRYLNQIKINATEVEIKKGLIERLNEHIEQRPLTDDVCFLLVNANVLE